VGRPGHRGTESTRTYFGVIYLSLYCTLSCFRLRRRYSTTRGSSLQWERRPPPSDSNPHLWVHEFDAGIQTQTGFGAFQDCVLSVLSNPLGHIYEEVSISELGTHGLSGQQTLHRWALATYVIPLYTQLEIQSSMREDRFYGQDYRGDGTRDDSEMS